jgi:hypothetical protein
MACSIDLFACHIFSSLLLAPASVMSRKYLQYCAECYNTYNPNLRSASYVCVPDAKISAAHTYNIAPNVTIRTILIYEALPMCVSLMPKSNQCGPHVVISAASAICCPKYI